MTNDQKVALASVIGQVAGIAFGAFINHAKTVKRAGGFEVVNARKAIDAETDQHNQNAFIRALSKANVSSLSRDQQLHLLNAVKLRASQRHSSGSSATAECGSKIVGIDAKRLGQYVEESAAFLGLPAIEVVKYLPPKANVAIVKLAALPAMLDAANRRM